MNMTPAEQEALEQIEKAKAAGQDPFGDNDDTDTSTDTAAEAQAAADAQAAKEAEEAAAAKAAEDEAAAAAAAQEAGKDPASDDALSEDALSEIANPAADPLNLLNFQAEVPQDYKTQRQALMTEKAEAMDKLMDGTIDSKEYAAIETRVADALEELTAARIRAETLQEAQAQSHARYQQQQLTSIAAQAKKAGELDYMADKTAQRQFDIALQGLKADPENATKDFAELVQDAHAAVLAMRGVARKSAPAASAQPADRKPDGQAPVTLRSLPNAAQSNTGGDVIAGLGRLKGEEYENAFSKLTPAQRRALLDD